MQLTAETESGLYVYTESFWTGRKELTYNGVPLQKLNKKTFLITRNGVTSQITVKGNYITGVTLQVEGENIVMVKNKWYDWLLLIMPMLGLVVGILGGAIGGALSALFACIGAIGNVTILRGKLPIVLKVVLCILIAVAVNVAWFLIYAAIVGGLANAFPSLF